MSSAPSLLLQYLQQLRDQRLDRVRLTPEVQRVLLGQAARASLKPEPRPAAQVSPGRESMNSEPLSLKSALRETLQEAPASRLASQEPSPRPMMPAAEVTRPLSKEEALLQLKEVFQKDPSMRALPTLRGQAVFSTGSAEAEIMFIGEAPGAEEERQQEPFVGPAGQLLTKIIQAMGLRRQEVYITNICKFRPKMGDGISQGSKNRPPTVEEMELGLRYVLKEIEVVQPKMIVALGATAANGLGIEGSVGKLRAATHEFRQIPVVVTYHPSYLLRKEQDDGGGIAEKRLVWEDMMTVMEYVGLPVSTKQRAYFSKRPG